MMPKTGKGARPECVAASPRPTVADRRAADEIVSRALGFCGLVLGGTAAWLACCALGDALARLVA
nr:MAG TPA: hypothetical protein [Caudoviricetes sp.]